MRIAELQIDRYGPLGRIRETCEDGITVVHGPNESGKTLLLEGVLKLLDPSVGRTYPQIQRVGETPSGYVILETADGEVKLGGGTTLPDIAPIEAAHLRNLFTVRDSDLRLHDQHAFYDSLTEQIGDLHTSEIEAIRAEFEDRGRLTSTRRNLSSAADADHAKEVRDRAAQLAQRIEAYVETATADDVGEAERRLLAVKRELRTCQTALEEQERAETVAEYERLRTRLDTYEEATRTLADRYGYTQDELDRLRSLDHSIATATETVEAATDEIASLEGDIERAETELVAARSEEERLERRRDAIDEVESRLETVREGRAGVDGAERTLQTTRRLAGAGIAGSGVAGAAGALTGSGPAFGVAVVLLLVGLVSAAGWAITHRRISGVERRTSALLEAARDAGLEVASVSDVAPAIQAYREALEAAGERVATLEQRIKVAEQRIDDHESTIAAAEAELDEHREERRERLDAAGVDGTDAYQDALRESADLRRQRSAAEQSLADGLGMPETSDPGPEVLIDYWTDRLTTMVADHDVEEIDPGVFDETELATLRARREELTAERDELAEQLAAHDRTVREFADEARDIRAEPFVGEPIELSAETVDGLEQLRRDLQALVDQIERDATISRIGLELFDRIHDEEEEKITDLFDGAGRATEAFRAITQDRYVDVTYDTDEQVLTVEDAAGRELTPPELSHGTREQLYFATRVSLSEQLLGNEPGFFLLDDAFLPADRTRLEAGFDVLRSLSADGWQVIYLTAKAEVGEDLVEAYGLPCVELEPLP